MCGPIQILSGEEDGSGGGSNWSSESVMFPYVQEQDPTHANPGGIKNPGFADSGAVQQGFHARGSSSILDTSWVLCRCSKDRFCDLWCHKSTAAERSLCHSTC